MKDKVEIKEKVAIYIFFTLFIGLTLAIGTYHLVDILNETKGKETTDAIVIGYERKEVYQHSDPPGTRIVYSETVQYVVDGVTYVAQNDVWSNPPKGLGETMKIAYDPDAPYNCVFVNSEIRLPIGLYVMSAVGIALLIANIVSDVRKRKNQKLMAS